MKRVFLMTPLLCAALLAQSGRGLQYSKEGKLLLPPDYREWVFLSSGLGMTYPNERPPTNPFFDNVFVDPAAYKAFLKSGAWPDKTVLVVELRNSETKVSINKDGRVQTTDVAGTEIHVKDSARGGWAFYGFPKGAKEGSLIPKTQNCYSCHEQNGAVDTTFVQFYPTLIEIAKSKGTFKEAEK
jgi:hypothetical protein